MTYINTIIAHTPTFLILVNLIFVFCVPRVSGEKTQALQPQQAPAWSLVKADVTPRLFTPNGDGINDSVVFVIQNNSLATIYGKIFDSAGGEISDIKPAPSHIPTFDSMVWDGRDSGGNVVPAGVYIYEFKGEELIINGTVVVVK